MFDQALGTMEAALAHSGEAVVEDVLRAFAQWLQGTGGRGAAPAALLQHTLVARTLQELQGVERFDLAVDVMDELIYCTVFMNQEGLAQPRQGMEPLIMVRDALCLQDALPQTRTAAPETCACCLRMQARLTLLCT